MINAYPRSLLFYHFHFTNFKFQSHGFTSRLLPLEEPPCKCAVRFAAVLSVVLFPLLNAMRLILLSSVISTALAISSTLPAAGLWSLIRSRRFPGLLTRSLTNAVGVFVYSPQTSTIGCLFHERCVCKEKTIWIHGVLSNKFMEGSSFEEDLPDFIGDIMMNNDKPSFPRSGKGMATSVYTEMMKQLEVGFSCVQSNYPIASVRRACALV